MTKEVKLEKVVYADWRSAYRAWVTGLDTEPPLEGAFFGGWLVREVEIERLTHERDEAREVARMNATMFNAQSRQLNEARAAANAQRAINDALGAGEVEQARAALADADAAGMALVRDNERLLAEIERIKVQTDWAEIDRLRAALQEIIDISYVSLLPDRVVELATEALGRAKVG